MKQRIMKALSVTVVVGVLITNTVGVYGYKKVIKIPRLGAGETKISCTRSGDYSYVRTGCLSVYPTTTNQEDNFTRIRAKLRNEKGYEIGKETILKENAGYSDIHIYDGNLNTKNIVFCFYGNSEKYPAEAVVEYFPK